MASGHHAHTTLGQAKYNRTMAKTPPSAGVFRLDTARTRKVQKEKKMGWLKKKFAKWSRDAWENNDKSYAVDAIRAHDGISGKSSIRFTIYPASGGFVIEHCKQDRFKDGDGPTLTIVNHGDDLGKAVEHIIALEALKA